MKTPRVDIRDEAGIGLMELLLAMMILSIALLVLVASFSSAAAVMKRASATSTAGVIADSQMERYRAMTYDWIGLNTSAATDATYQGDVACVGDSTCSNVAPAAGASACQSGSTTVYAVFPLNCAPTQTIVGPDHRNYRLDTYIRAVQSVSSGNPRQTKLVTVVVRDPTTGHLYAREESDFDYCAALPDPSGTGAAC